MKKTHFAPLYSQPYSLGDYPDFMTIGEGAFKNITKNTPTNWSKQCKLIPDKTIIPKQQIGLFLVTAVKKVTRYMGNMFNKLNVDY